MRLIIAALLAALVAPAAGQTVTGGPDAPTITNSTITNAPNKPLIVFSQVLKDVFGKPLPPACMENEFDPVTHQPVIDPVRGQMKCKEWGEYTLGYACIVALSTPIAADTGETLDKKVARELLAAKIARSAESHVPIDLSAKERRLIVDRLDKFDPSRQPFGSAVAVLIVTNIDPASIEERK